MPVASKPSRSVSGRAAKTTRRSAPRATFQEPLVAAPPTESDRPQDHKGIPVSHEELQSNLPNGAAFKVSRLHLADGTTAYACRDCLHTADTRADVQHHRNAVHGARFGKKTPRVIFPADKNVGDLVLPERQPGVAAPSDPMQMTIAELLALMPSIGAVGDLVDRAEHERDLAKIELEERRRHDRENAHKIAVYDSLQAQIVELRMLVKHTGSYEQMKTELLALRAWKKKIMSKLDAVGFKFIEEDQ